MSRAARRLFEGRVPAEQRFFTSTVVAAGDGLTYEISLVAHVPTVGSRSVHIAFLGAAPETPRVHVVDGASPPGPSGWSPHRYDDGSLCMWHPRDVPELRWELSDGLAALVGHVQAHLVREAWWRDVGEWPGPEAPHKIDLTVAAYLEDIR